ncbi:transcriptional regulator [Halobacteriales archaeon QS_8_69_26]|nr:MAG: transcriptional regulator [Halobacteriales archaeon QS_8_69_26]
MAKYSTGGSSGSGGGESCELCGTTSDELVQANVAGATLQVCPDCRPYDDAAKTDDGAREGTRDEDEPDRRQRAVQNAARTSGVWNDDSEHWEREGAGYDDDQLPYLVDDYGARLEAARQDAGLQREELAEELGIREADILAIEQERANQAGVGGSIIGALEEHLGIQLSEE